jgi:hypothetical protein
LRQAPVFAARNGLNVCRTGLPTRVEYLANPGEAAQFTHQPRYEYGGEVVARIDLQVGLIYLGRREPSDLYLELAKWFFYSPTYRWGQDARRDAEQRRLIADFADFCLDRKSWVEAGGSSGWLR